MNILKRMAIGLMLVTLLPSAISAKTVMKPKGYLFGFVANFTDSVVYFTDIQEIDSVYFDSKSGFLIGREEYSIQLRDYFTNQLNMPHRTCIVSFRKDRKDAEKKYVKLRKLYTEKHAGKYDVRYINVNEFKFTAIPAGDTLNQTAPAPKKAKKSKKEKKSKRKAKK